MNRMLRSASLAGVCVAVLSGCGGMEEQVRDELELGQVESGLTLTGFTVSLGTHGGTGGTAVTLGCPAGYVAVGIFGREADNIDQLGLRCAYLYSTGALGASANTGTAGGMGGSSFALNCPLGQAVVGFHGRDAARVDALGLYCSTPTNWLSTNSPQYTTVAVGGTGGIAFADAPIRSHLVTAIQARAGARVDQIRGIVSLVNP
ncbi:hypothetical protein LXT21_40095 [Myxococcus sp. K38C18041901]|uniref:hypothetical protein n=1 Tax=Myxococcus guangdongensis TaxID=2906760 RepID=UPI0020A7B50E|nr:hypothetical protein [Myxococcus guangdongensis]MCP3064994.1 hypothetical protein [Myxococcus guangdongensis]